VAGRGGLTQLGGAVLIGRRWGGVAAFGRFSSARFSRAGPDFVGGAGEQDQGPNGGNGCLPTRLVMLSEKSGASSNGRVRSGIAAGTGARQGLLDRPACAGQDDGQISSGQPSQRGHDLPSPSTRKDPRPPGGRSLKQAVGCWAAEGAGRGEHAREKVCARQGIS